MKYFSVVDALTYIIPGSVLIFAMKICNVLTEIRAAFAFEDSTLLIPTYVIAAYLIGFVMHFPAVLVGRSIVKIFGNPAKYLSQCPPEGNSRFIKNIRRDYSNDFKNSLHEAMVNYWHSQKTKTSHFGYGQYYELCEALIEDSYKNAWDIHERFYTSANLSRAMIIPIIILGISIWSVSIPYAIILLISSIVFGYRYYTLLIAASKQVLNTFYLHYLDSLLLSSKS